jgi:hypothetical protein
MRIRINIDRNGSIQCPTTEFRGLYGNTTVYYWAIAKLTICVVTPTPHTICGYRTGMRSTYRNIRYASQWQSIAFNHIDWNPRIVNRAIPKLTKSIIAPTQYMPEAHHTRRSMTDVDIVNVVKYWSITEIHILRNATDWITTKPA